MAREHPERDLVITARIRASMTALGNGDMKKGLHKFLRLTDLQFVQVRKDRPDVNIVGNVVSFIAKNYTILEDGKRGGLVSDMYAHYIGWCNENECEALGRNKFNREVRIYGIRLAKSTCNLLCFYGAVRNTGEPRVAAQWHDRRSNNV